jgi:N-acetylglucosaminyldiphosphoundecaprenol N-acetyl-beta-D-mannosaminyltransferase
LDTLAHHPTRPASRLRIGTLPVDPLTFDETIAALLALAEAGRGGTVFTPNVDHVVRAEHDLAFRAAYAAASLSVVDGMPLMWAARLLGTPLPQKISGSDWFEPLLAACARAGHGVYFIGGRQDAGSTARDRLLAKFPTLRIAGVGPRTRDIESDLALLDQVREDLRRTRPAFAVVALGSPLQEIWAAQVREAVAPTVLLGLGSVLDLAAGFIPRAPRWASKVGLEWLYRLLREPRRLWRRYLVRDPAFAGVVLRQWLKRPR